VIIENIMKSNDIEAILMNHVRKTKAIIRINEVIVSNLNLTKYSEFQVKRTEIKIMVNCPARIDRDTPLAPKISASNIALEI
tara:strand:- start:167 stop:412 length:246 start_codon:yes stop_codon:yes gene_type:complete